MIQSFYVEATKIIPLGAACESALYLRETRLRKTAYPFDWIISGRDGLLKAIDEDFAHFLEDCRLWNNRSVIDYYGFEYPHDWPNAQSKNMDLVETDFIGTDVLLPEWQAALPQVKEKYRRRIERFINACKEPEPVIFIRSEHINKDLAIEIRDLIRRKYPKLDFVIVAVANNEEFRHHWNLEDIYNYRRHADAAPFLRQSVEKGYIDR